MARGPNMARRAEPAPSMAAEQPPLLAATARVALELAAASEFARSHAIEVASIRLGELRNALPAAVEAAPEPLRERLAALLQLI